MKKLWKYLFKYKLLFFTRVLTISLAALSVICFDFMMGFIVDIFSNGETEKFVPIILASIFLIILLFVTECVDGYVMSSYIKNTVNYLRCDIFTKILNKDMKDFFLDNSGKYISILYNDIKIIEDSLLNNIFLVISSFNSAKVSNSDVSFANSSSNSGSSFTLIAFTVHLNTAGFPARSFA